VNSLPLIDPATADGELADLFGSVKAGLGTVINMTKAMANSPALLNGYWGFAGALGTGVLPARTREMLALTVAQANSCGYCLSAHAYLAEHVAHLDAETVCFGERCALVDHLLENLLIDAELLQQLVAHIAAVGIAVRLQLSLIGAPEFAGCDFMPLHTREGVVRGGIGAGPPQEVGDIENDERQAHQTETPLEPVLVPAHPIEHCHWNTFGNLQSYAMKSRRGKVLRSAVCYIYRG
jgi:AhpD family alkylhydroperoxidase